MDPTDSPTPLDVLALLLNTAAPVGGGVAARDDNGGLLLDVGAGYGLHTLAAAAQGHRYGADWG